MVYSEAWGKVIYEKNQKSKISWHCPFNNWRVGSKTFPKVGSSVNFLMKNVSTGMNEIQRLALIY